jgi:hypothetical protein
MKELQFNAKDLRIGNKVDLYGSIATIQAIDFSTGYAITKGRPISLTEEILFKCGFNKIYVTDPQLENSQSKWYIDDLEIFKFEDNHEYLFFSFGQDFKIIYLHQLQNLYFELTGKELEIKL